MKSKDAAFKDCQVFACECFKKKINELYRLLNDGDAPFYVIGIRKRLLDTRVMFFACVKCGKLKHIVYKKDKRKTSQE